MGGYILRLAICVFLASPLLVSAGLNSSFNPIFSPEDEDIVSPGVPWLVEWDPTTIGPVSLFVLNFGTTTGSVIADSIEASLGEYNWNVPASWAANTTDPNNPFLFEMRIYQGSLGLSTTDISSFESRQYDTSDGYFAITNDTDVGEESFTYTVYPASPTTTQSFSRTRSTSSSKTTTTGFKAGGTTSTFISGTGTAKATRVPTFLAVVSEATKLICWLDHWKLITMVALGMIIGAMV
jgi:hypothetical protein